MMVINAISNTDPDEFIRRLKQAGASRRRQFRLLRLKIDQDFDSDMAKVLSCSDFDLNRLPPPDATPPQDLPFISTMNYMEDFSSDVSYPLR